MSLLLMPKATAVWLVENTTLTFIQIGDFCKLHELEVQAIADGEVAVGIVGLDPVTNGQLTKEEIERCEADPMERLKIAKSDIPQPVARQKGPRYTPVSKRADKPDAIAWMLKNQPDLTDAQISRLIGTTKPTINAVRDRTHWNSSNLQPRSPVEVGLCTHQELHDAVVLAVKKAAKKRPKDEDAAETESAPEPAMLDPIPEPAAAEPDASADPVENAESFFKPTEAPAEEEEAPEPTIADIWPSDKTESV
ncbi:MAG: DUF1013 domain-containing protein [Alphaproteobacteria bacterium]|nr:DUF1013 domain-containing protein [Alphaproteobacteria bacterium]